MNKIDISVYRGQVWPGTYKVFQYEYFGSTLQKWPVIKLRMGESDYYKVTLEATPLVLLQIAARLVIERLKHLIKKATRQMRRGWKWLATLTKETQ